MFIFWYIVASIVNLIMFYLPTKIMVKDDSYGYYSYSRHQSIHEETKFKYKRWQWIIILCLCFCPYVNFMAWIGVAPIAWLPNKFSQETKEKFKKTFIYRFINYLNEEV